MPNLFLIAHKVRGEPAFDVAEKIDCPECRKGYLTEPAGCVECDHLGFWWIIPTSGHRAYPIIYWELDMLYQRDKFGDYSPLSVVDESGPLTSHPNFEAVPDHYTTHASTSRPAIDISGLLEAKPKVHIQRRY